MKTARSAALLERGKAVIPGGVNSPVRAFKGVGGTPLFISRAKGSKIWDVDGAGYVDYVGSWGPMILGHADEAVVAATTKAVERSSSFGAPTEGEVRLAELVVKRVPSVERLRLVSSGTEATMSAIRLARAYTKRDGVVKLEGCYHGHADFLLVKAGSGVATFDLPDSPGVPADFAKHTHTVPYNDLAAAEALFEAQGGKLACMIIEPVSGNMGVIPPKPGYLEGLRALTERHGALLIYDEVMTGFRLHAAGAQGLFDQRPDLSCFGKIIGGGMPMAAFGGRAEIMDMIAPAGPVYQAGTLSGNPAAVAAGMSTLEGTSTPGRYEQLEKASALLQAGLEEALETVGITGRVQRVGSMLTLYFADQPVEDFADAKAADHERYAAFFHAMLERGVYLPPSGYESWFVSMAHTEDDISLTVNAAREALSAIKELGRALGDDLQHGGLAGVVLAFEDRPAQRLAAHELQPFEVAAHGRLVEQPLRLVRTAGLQLQLLEGVALHHEAAPRSQGRRDL